MEIIESDVEAPAEPEYLAEMIQLDHPLTLSSLYPLVFFRLDHFLRLPKEVPVEGKLGRNTAPKRKSKPSPKKKMDPKPKVKLAKKANKVKEKNRGTANKKEKKKKDDGDSYKNAYSRIYKRELAAGATLEQAGSVTTIPDGPIISR